MGRLLVEEVLPGTGSETQLSSGPVTFATAIAAFANQSQTPIGQWSGPGKMIYRRAFTESATEHGQKFVGHRTWKVPIEFRDLV